MTTKEALELLKAHDNLSEDRLTEIAQALGYTDLDRNFFHDKGARSGQALLNQRIQKQGGPDKVLAADKNSPQSALQRQLAGAEGQLGDLGALAAGQLPTNTQQDQDIVRDSIGLTRDMAQRELEAVLPQLLGRASAGAGAQGLTGGSAEVANRAITVAGAHRDLSNLVGQAGLAGGQALLQLPFQRAGVQIGANQAIWDRFVGSVNPLLQDEQFGRQLDFQREQAAQSRKDANRARWGKILGSAAHIGLGLATGGASVPFTMQMGAGSGYRDPASGDPRYQE